MKALQRAATHVALCSAVVALSFGVLATSARAQQNAATCSTFNSSNEPSSAFRGGERIVIRGSGFIPRSTVLLSVQQNSRNLELGKVAANDLGAFDLSTSVVPPTVTTGRGAIRALDARNSATCAVTLRAGTSAGRDDALKPVLIGWGAVLAVFAVILTALTYRRWKADRLQEAFDRLAWSDQASDRREANGRGEGNDVFAPTAFDDEDLSHEDFMAQLIPPDLTPPPPERLPASWDQRTREPRPASDAIEKLQREVKDWKR